MYILFITKLEYQFMYILFISLGGRCDFFFLLNFIIIVIKKMSNPQVQLDPCGVGWVGLGWTLMMGWVKISPQRDSCTPLVITQLFFFFCFHAFFFSHVVEWKLPLQLLTHCLLNIFGQKNQFNSFCQSDGLCGPKLNFMN